LSARNHMRYTNSSMPIELTMSRKTNHVFCSFLAACHSAYPLMATVHTANTARIGRPTKKGNGENMFSRPPCMYQVFIIRGDYSTQVV